MRSSIAIAWHATCGLAKIAGPILPGVAWCAYPARVCSLRCLRVSSEALKRDYARYRFKALWAACANWPVSKFCMVA